MVTFNWRIMLGDGLNHLELSVHPTVQTVSCGKKTKHFTQKSQTVKTWVVGNRNSMNSLPLKTVSVFPRVFSCLFPAFFWKKRNDSYFWGVQGFNPTAISNDECRRPVHTSTVTTTTTTTTTASTTMTVTTVSTTTVTSRTSTGFRTRTASSFFVVFVAWIYFLLFTEVLRSTPKKTKSHGAPLLCFFSWRPLIKEWT